MSRNRNENSAAAPILGNQLILGQLLLYSVYIGAGLIDLVDCNNNLYLCCLCMVNCLNGLGHNAVVCSNNQNCNICRLGAAHTHSGKCLMSRCIQESNLLSPYIYSISTDVLGNSSCLSGGYIALSDCIQKRGFTMVNMAHNADNRRSGNHIFLIFLIFLQKLCNYIYLFFLLAENLVLHSDLFCLFKIDLRV